MNFFLKIAAWLFHPLWMPLLGVILYYRITPRYIIPEVMYSKIVVVFILTFLIPILLFFLLKTMGLVKSIHMEDVKERKIPTVLQSLLILLIIRMVFHPHLYPELYAFFIGILFSLITAFVLVSAKFKVSFHMIGIAGLTMFIIALSIHFKVNVLWLIAFLLFVNGWVASSRLHTKSHTNAELIFGFFVGMFPQLLLVNYWL